MQNICVNITSQKQEESQPNNKETTHLKYTSSKRMSKAHPKKDYPKSTWKMLNTISYQ